MNGEITNKELKVWLEGEFKAVKEEMRGLPLPERADKMVWTLGWNWFRGMAIFIASLMIPC